MTPQAKRTLLAFYGTKDGLGQDELLSASARGLAERNEASQNPAVAAAAAQDRIDWRKHDERYHGGKYEPGEPCGLREKILKLEAEQTTLDPNDADGDGKADFPVGEEDGSPASEFEEAEEGAESESPAEDDAVSAYFKEIDERG